MWTLLLFTYECLAYADVSRPATIYIHVSDKPINLTSPRFPTEMYPPNINTHYNITVSPNYALKLTIVSLNLEPRCCDYFQIIELNRPIYTFRGILPSLSPFYFTSRHLLFVFRTDAKGNFPGFQLTLERTLWAPQYPLGRCGYQCMATPHDQSVYSPYFLYNFVDNSICTWTIVA